ncbi:hypothetical protein FACS18945_4280 [Bacteroidia bacterium]|nr:hypothetical protein FACS18945_4280 [Bacteroidia bacterium]
MNKYKHIGIILAVTTLIVLLTINTLLNKLEMGFNLCVNELPIVSGTQWGAK